MKPSLALFLPQQLTRMLNTKVAHHIYLYPPLSPKITDLPTEMSLAITAEKLQTANNGEAFSGSYFCQSSTHKLGVYIRTLNEHFQNQIRASKITSVKQADMKYVSCIHRKNCQISVWRLLESFSKQLQRPQGVRIPTSIAQSFF